VQLTWKTDCGTKRIQLVCTLLFAQQLCVCFKAKLLAEKRQAKVISLFQEVKKWNNEKKKQQKCLNKQIMLGLPLNRQVIFFLFLS
jgi:hypothetical protein